MNSNKRFNPILTLAFALGLARPPATAAEDLAAMMLGYVEPYRIITLSAAEAGVISDVLVKEGDAVKKGQVLAKLDTATLEAELDVAQAEARLQATRKQRLDELATSSRATPDELEKARTDLTIKDAQVRKFRAMIETRLMRSPVDGVVNEIKRDPARPFPRPTRTS